MSNTTPSVKRIFVDIEVSPNLVLTWRTGFDLVIPHDSIVTERKIICIGYKFQGDKKTTVLTWDNDKQDDKELLEKFIPIINEADEVVWFHGDRFDGKWIRTRNLINKLPPTPQWKTIDPKKWASSLFLFNCNKLAYIGKVLGVGEKLPSGYDLWKDIVLKKCDKALKKMTTYCAGDVDLLEAAYIEMEPYTKVKTNAAVYSGLEEWQCPRTGSRNVSKSKTRVSAAGTKTHQMINNETGAFYTISERAYQNYLKSK